MVQISDILKYLSEIGIEYQFIGDEGQFVSYFSSLENYRPDTFTWINEASNLPKEIEPSEIKLAFVGPELFLCAQNLIKTRQSKFAFLHALSISTIKNPPVLRSDNSLMFPPK